MGKAIGKLTVVNAWYNFGPSYVGFFTDEDGDERTIHYATIEDIKERKDMFFTDLDMIREDAEETCDMNGMEFVDMTKGDQADGKAV